MNRRKLLKNITYGSLGLGAGVGLYTWQIEPFWLEFVHHKLPVKSLPDHLKGRTIMQISDMHVGNRFDYNYIIKSFKTAQLLDPDIVVYTGDYVSYEDERQFQQLEEVLQHAVRGRLGTIGILGNHDYGKNWSEQAVADKITSQLENAGIEMLNNRNTVVQGLNIIGLDDFWALNFDPEDALNTYDESMANLVLCHNPDVCDLDVWNEYRGWILSGHTHGGQCKPPFLNPPLLPVKNRRYTSGKFELGNGRSLYINRALGHSIQVRFNVRPEITVFRME